MTMMAVVRERKGVECYVIPTFCEQCTTKSLHQTCKLSEPPVESTQQNQEFWCYYTVATTTLSKYVLISCTVIRVDKTLHVTG